MNKFFSVLVLGSALALSACGGDSDSSGSNNNTQAKPTPPNTNPVKPAPTNPKPPAIPKCKIEGKNIYVPNGGGCTTALPKVNKGKESYYECSGGIVSLGGISAGTLNFSGHIITCAK